MIGSVASADVACPVSVPEAVEEDAGLVERGDDRQPQLLAELEVLGAAARGDVDDARALVLPDLAPRHDDVLVRVVGVVARARREGRPDRGQVIERTLVAPADHVGPGHLVERPRTRPRAAVFSVPLPTQNRSSPWRTWT